MRVFPGDAGIVDCQAAAGFGGGNGEATGGGRAGKQLRRLQQSRRAQHFPLFVPIKIFLSRETMFSFATEILNFKQIETTQL